MNISSNENIISLFESKSLNIFGGACDNSDICSKGKCQFNDDSEAATISFLDAYADFCASLDKKIKKIKLPNFCPVLNHIPFQKLKFLSFNPKTGKYKRLEI